MRIGIDARFYGSLGKGLGRYTSELITQLELLDTKNNYVIFLGHENWEEYQPKNPRFKKVLADIKWYGFAEQIWFPFLLLRHNIDLMHFPHFNVPVLYRKPIVVTIHDLILLHFPTQKATTLSPLVYKIKFLLYKTVIKSALKRAKAVFTVSEHAKNEIVESFPFMKQKPPIVTYPACGVAFHANINKGKTTLDVPTPYMLYVGSAYPHKNLERLVNAFSQFRKTHHTDFHLILVGGKDHFYNRLEEDAKKNGTAENILFFGHATDAELTALYDSASFYIFPSEYEGFGLPPLEAMCRGIAVTSSHASCLPEILGKSALFFDPKKEKDIEAAMRKMADDNDLKDKLIDAGRTWSTRYDWKKTAATTLKTYENVLHPPTP